MIRSLRAAVAEARRHGDLYFAVLVPQDRIEKAFGNARWFWQGCVVDGSTITMPDTPANQAAYPQMKAQKPGCGFPIARILVIFSLSVGTVLEAAIGPIVSNPDVSNGGPNPITSSKNIDIYTQTKTSKTLTKVHAPFVPDTFDFPTAGRAGGRRRSSG